MSSAAAEELAMTMDSTIENEARQREATKKTKVEREAHRLSGCLGLF